MKRWLRIWFGLTEPVDRATYAQVVDQHVEAVREQVWVDDPGEPDGVEEVDHGQRRAVLPVVVEDAGFGGGIVRDEQVGRFGEAAVEPG